MTKGVFIGCKWMKDRQYNDQRERYKRTNIDIQNTNRKND